jgi:hypothetical protein
VLSYTPSLSLLIFYDVRPIVTLFSLLEAGKAHPDPIRPKRGRLSHYHWQINLLYLKLTNRQQHDWPLSRETWNSCRVISEILENVKFNRSGTG